jgi:hypothetical protein
VSGWARVSWRPGVEVGIGVEELVPAGDGVAEEVERVTAADKDTARIIGVVARPGGVARIGWLLQKSTAACA